MNDTVLTIEDAARSLKDVVDRVYTSGEATTLTRSGRPVARIVPVLAPSRPTDELIAFLRQWQSKHPEPDEQFGTAIEESRQAVHPPHDPWE